MYFIVLTSGASPVSRATVVFFFVSILLLFTQLLYFIRKLVILAILDRECFFQAFVQSKCSAQCNSI